MGPRLRTRLARAWADRKIPACRAQFGVHAPRHDRVVVLPGLAGRVAHRRAARHAALNVMLRAYGDGADTEAALRKATGRGVADLQRDFDAMLAERYSASGRPCRHWRASTFRSAPTSDAEGARREARRQLSRPDDRGPRTRGRRRREDAIAAFGRAAMLVPSAIGHPAESQIAQSPSGRATSRACAN